MSGKPPSLSPAQALIQCIESHKSSPYVAITPLRAVLPLVAAWVASVEDRIRTMQGVPSAAALDLLNRKVDP